MSADARKTVLVTGARGFIGRNILVPLLASPDFRVMQATRDTSPSMLEAMAGSADVVVHLAGVNRPEREEEFEEGNVGFTRTLCELLVRSGRPVRLIVASSIQAENDSLYGLSKRGAEDVIRAHAEAGRIDGIIFRLPNVFGKWCRPNYNSVVATFCHNLAHGLPIHVADPGRMLRLVYIDDVVAALLGAVENGAAAAAVGGDAAEAIPAVSITLGELADRVRRIAEARRSLVMPDMGERINRQLYATFLSHLEPGEWEYTLDRRADDRGDLAEFIKSHGFGQIFVSRTRPGVTRGNHYHNTKTEKFLVLSGDALIRFRHVEGGEVVEFAVRGEDYRVLEIPPGYTHSITNMGSTEMITLFWASEIFDPARPDTQFLEVDGGDAVVAR